MNAFKLNMSNLGAKVLSMRELVGDTMLPYWTDGMLHHNYVLIIVGSVQKSGATIYFRPANNDFTANGGKTYFDTYAKAHQSENW